MSKQVSLWFAGCIYGKFKFMNFKPQIIEEAKYPVVQNDFLEFYPSNRIILNTLPIVWEGYGDCLFVLSKKADEALFILFEELNKRLKLIKENLNIYSEFYNDCFQEVINFWYSSNGTDDAGELAFKLGVDKDLVFKALNDKKRR